MFSNGWPIPPQAAPRLLSVNEKIFTEYTNTQVALNCDVYDGYACTALSSALTINNPTGLPADGQDLLLKIKDNGTARAFSWGTAFVAVGAPLLASTVLSKAAYIWCVYNGTTGFWEVFPAQIEV